MHYHLLSLTLLLCSFIHLHQSEGVDWNYHELGSEVWKDFFPQCGGSSQSPINIKTACTVYRSFSPFNFSSSYGVSQDFLLINNGHTISGAPVNATALPRTLSGGGLNGTYEFVNFHLHWGENYASGSEHSINGEKYAGEIHFLHQNRQTNHYAALAVFMKSKRDLPVDLSELSQRRKRDDRNTSDATTAEWERYVTTASSLYSINESAVIRLNLNLLMGGYFDKFWRYSGSVTVPPCTETVTWTVFTTPIVFSDLSLLSFRQNVLDRSFRDPQPLNNRVVYRNFPNETMSPISDYQCCSNNTQ